MTRISRIGRGGGNRFDNPIVSRRSSDSMGNTSSDFVVFSTSVNRADGISEIEGKAARVAAREGGPSAFQIRAIRGSSLSVSLGDLGVLCVRFLCPQKK